MSSHKIVGRDPGTGRTLSLLLEEDTISHIEPCEIDTDLFLSAGFVDLQVNGCAGFDVNADLLNEEMIFGLVRAMLSRGVTCFAPTIITAPEKKICQALRVVSQARQKDPVTSACIPFVHVEGPHISPQDGYRGAHAKEWVRPPSVEEFDRWQDVCDGLVGLVTISPHFDESAQYVAALCERGVHVAIGHTHASLEQIVCAVDAGARLSTHLGNGIASEIARHRNPIWVQLAEDRLTASFIGDGHHLPPTVLKSMLRAKGLDRSILVSDSVALSGMPKGIYSTPVGGSVELGEDGRLCVLGSELLAGATASLSQCIGIVVRATGMELFQALEMVTKNPGRFVKGREQMAIGSRADVIRFRWNGEIRIEDVWLAGQQVFSSKHQESNA